MSNNSEISYLVSNYDIENKFHHSTNIKIMVYSDLSRYSSILQLLKSNKSACFILLRTSNNSGHWTVLTRNGNTITYFDSYGKGPDKEMQYVENRASLGENVLYLSKLIQTIPEGYTFQFNKTQFQSKRQNVNTCGKWCTVFTKIIFEGLTLEDFKNRINQLKAQYKVSLDQLVCDLFDAF